MKAVRALNRCVLSASVSISALAICLSPFVAGPAAAATSLPSGGQFAAGKGAIGSVAGSLVVKQSSTTGIIDWTSFSIGKTNSVTFDNGAGATLNEVTGDSLSIIAGALHASGSVFLIDRAGVIVSGTGRVVTGGSFGASTGADTKRGNVVDAGTIRSAHGSVILSGADVSVSGSITVMRGGRLWLTSSGTTAISGVLDADDARAAGGSIVATGKDIAVAGTANISASGVSKGGTILIGGDVHGGAIAADDFVKANVATAETTRIGEGARISANASQGAGGDIVIWSDGHTSYDGKISATGRTSGGFAEVSSHGLLGFDGTADLTSVSGMTGTLLLDPENVTISSAASATDTCSAGVCTPTGSDSVLNVATLQAALGSANVKVTTGSSGSQTGDITVAAPITWSAHTLTLDAYHAIYIDAAMSATGTAGLALKTDDGGTGGDYGFDLGQNGFAGKITFANTSESLTINGQAYTLIDSMTALQAINDNSTTLNGNYALANSLNASGTTNWDGIGTLTGNFEGLGNTIANLNGESLFASSSGTIRDIGIVGGAASGAGLVGYNSGAIIGAYASVSVSGSGDVGGLAGGNDGSISDSYATGSVSGAGASVVGGLVGYESENGTGTITNSYAAGKVSGGNSAYVGGLVGMIGTFQNGAFGGTVANSYATGAVSGGNGALVGGLVGYNFGGSVLSSYAMGSVSGGNNAIVGGLVGDAAVDVPDEFTWFYPVIANSYSVGAVRGGSGARVGGLLGVDYDFGSSVQGSYWDIQTSGIANLSQGAGNIANDSGVTGLTTAQLQGALPSGLKSEGFATGPGLFPYLSWQYPSGTPQAISGNLIGYNYSTTAIDILVNGAAVTPGLSMVSSVTGYYYLLVAPGTIGSSAAVLAYTSGSNAGASVESTSGSLQGLDIWEDSLIAPTNATTYSGAIATTLQKQDAILISQAVGSNGPAQNLVSGLTHYGYIAGGPGFVINEAVTAQNGLFIQTIGSDANIIVSDALTVPSGESLTLAASGNVELRAAVGGSGNLAIATGDVNDNLAIDEPLTAATIELDSAGTIGQSSAGIITAKELFAASSGSATLASDNAIDVLGSFTTLSGNLALHDSDALTVNGEVSAETGTLTLTTTGTKLAIQAPVTGTTVDLVSAGTITSGANGIIYAGELAGSSSGATTLGAPNWVSNLGTFTTGNGNFSLTNTGPLTVEEALDVGSGNLSLQTNSIVVFGNQENTEVSGSLTIDAPLTASRVDLAAGATIAESSAGIITASELTGSSGLQGALGASSGSASLTAANRIADLGAFEAAGDFSLTNTTALTISGAINDYASFSLSNAAALTVRNTVLAVNNLVLTTTGSGHNLVLDAGLSVYQDAVLLRSGGAITGNDAGTIDAPELEGASSGAVTLPAANQIGELGAFTTHDGAFLLDDAAALTVAGALNAGTGDVTLATSGAGNDLAIDATVTGGTVDFTSAGNVTESPAGAVIANLINVTADTGIDLDSSHNDIQKIGTDKTKTGSNVINQH